MKILVLGATGMLGNAMFRFLTVQGEHEVYGTVRSEKALGYFSNSLSKQLIVGVDAEQFDSIVKSFARVQPQFVINCVGLIKQLADVNDPLQAVPINTLLPHRLAHLCQATGARLIHVSTDCVFSGSKGHYLESDFPDAHDLYGRSKLLGEINYPHAVTLRTSIIGHELSGHRSLIGWFLQQQGTIKGYRQAIFSGLPTVELAHVVHKFVLPRSDLHGLYHVAAEPISKYELLKLVGEIYGKETKVVPDDQLVINRSLNADRFSQATGYSASNWSELIKRMYDFK